MDEYKLDQRIVCEHFLEAKIASRCGSCCKMFGNGACVWQTQLNGDNFKAFRFGNDVRGIGAGGGIMKIAGNASMCANAITKCHEHKTAKTLVDYYVGGNYAQYLEARVPASSDMELISVTQPAGNYPHGATNELWLSVQTRGNGSAILDLGGGRFTATMGPGDILVRAFEAPGNYTIQHDHSFDLISIPFLDRTERILEEIGIKSADFGVVHSSALRSPLIEQVINGIKQWAMSGDAVPRIVAESSLTLTLAALHQIQLQASARKTMRGGLSQANERKIIRYMWDMMASDLSLFDLAGLVGYSRYHFIRAFTVSFGVSPYQYLSRMRIDQAVRLLRTTRLSVEEIGILCGFRTRSSFLRQFRQQVGKTPLDVRRNGQ